MKMTPKEVNFFPSLAIMKFSLCALVKKINGVEYEINNLYILLPSLCRYI